MWVPCAMSPMEDRILYAVSEQVGTAPGTLAFAQSGRLVSEGALGLYSISEESDPRRSARGDTAGGSSGQWIRAGLGLSGRRVSWVLVHAGMTQMIAGTTATAYAAAGLTPGTGISNADLALFENASARGVWAGVWAGAHDAALRARIIAWLKWRYQI